MKYKKIFKNVIWILPVVLGLGIMIYPLVSQIYYQSKFSNDVKEFQNAKSNIPSKDVENRIELARNYNNTLDPARIGDPFTSDEKKGREAYAKMLEIKEKIGYISIPKINQEIPIKAGTEESILEECAGHMEGTSLPIGGKGTHSVITAHRGLPNKRLFTDLDKLEKGDLFHITNIKETLTYKVDQILVVEPDDFEQVLVVESKDYVTLLTCTPYGVNSHRLLVRGERYILPEDDVKKEKVDVYRTYREKIIYIFIALIILAISFTLFWKRRRKFEK
ncbi:class C sortase [Parvimonas micra]